MSKTKGRQNQDENLCLKCRELKMFRVHCLGYIIKFENAVHASLHKFDVGLILFMSDNYGSIATNYALYRAINDMGKKAAVLESWGRGMGNQAVKFARSYMKLTGNFLETENGQAANQCFGTFVTGSDMTWNWKLNWFGRLLQFMMLGFADEKKRMISYASSFGNRKGEKDISEEERALGAYCLKRFDAISVREDYGVDMCRDLFSVQARQVLDPVLLCDKKVWDELSAKSQLKFDDDYLLAYILDPTPDKRQVILEAAQNMNKKLVVILDQELNIEGNRRAMNMDDKVVRPEFIDWLAYFQHASYVITDSMHGACFSIIFRKKFVAVKNRSKNRFDSLANLIGCPWLFFEDSKLLLGKTDIFAEIDYDTIYKRMGEKRMESEKWLRSALDIEVKPKSSNESTGLMLQLYKSMCAKTDFINKMMADYAYEEERKAEIAAGLKSGKTWLDMVSSRNDIVPRESKLRKINNLREYCTVLKADAKYVVILSGRDECASQWRKFLEISGFPLRADVQWRNSYSKRH